MDLHRDHPGYSRVLNVDDRIHVKHRWEPALTRSGHTVGHKERDPNGFHGEVPQRRVGIELDHGYADGAVHPLVQNELAEILRIDVVHRIELVQLAPLHLLYAAL